MKFDVFPGGPADGPVVLMLHGFPQHSGQWRDVVPPLHAAGLRSIAFDQRGYSPGARPAAVAEYAISECITDALSIMDALDVQAFHVTGHDWGAVVAWGLAAEHPDRVRSLTAISVPHPTAFWGAMRGEDQRTRSSYMGLFAQVDKAEQLLLADDAATLRAIYAGSGMSPERVDDYVRPMCTPGALRGALSWYAALQAYPIRFEPVVVPTTYVWGDADIAVGAQAAHGCADFVTGEYDFVPLDGLGHWLPDQVPEVIAAEIVKRVVATGNQADV